MKLLYLIISISYLFTIGCHDSNTNSKSKRVATIDYEMYGCFGSRQATISLNKTDDILLAEMIVDGKEKSVTKMDSVKMIEFERFISGLRKVGIGGCTTEERYEVTYKNERIVRKDGQCEWDGFSKLTQSLFGNPKRVLISLK